MVPVTFRDDTPELLIIVVTVPWIWYQPWKVLSLWARVWRWKHNPKSGCFNFYRHEPDHLWGKNKWQKLRGILHCPVPLETLIPTASTKSKLSQSRKIEIVKIVEPILFWIYQLISIANTAQFLSNMAVGVSQNIQKTSFED